MIRVLIVDDHPAVRSGLAAALRSEPGFVPIAAASGMTAALAETERFDPSAALVDYQLAEGDGLLLCHQLKLLPSPPAVVIYSAFARRELTIAAALAGADGMVDKGAPLDELFGSLRTAVRGGKALPVLRPEIVEGTVARLDTEDLPILGMRIDGATPQEIASVLHIDEREVSRRMVGMLRRLGDWRAAPAGTESSGDRNGSGRS